MAKSKKSVEPVAKKNKKEKKANNKSAKVEKKSLIARIKTYFMGLKKELKRIHFPNKKDLVKYSIATIGFIIFFGIFFYLIDILFALLQTLI